LDGSCFRITQMKNEGSDSTRDLGRMRSDLREKSGGASTPPEYCLPELMLSQLQTAFRGYLLGFFLTGGLTGGFFSPPLVLISAK
jgi:hypothetical protein